MTADEMILTRDLVAILFVRMNMPQSEANVLLDALVEGCRKIQTPQRTCSVPGYDPDCARKFNTVVDIHTSKLGGVWNAKV